MALQKENPSIQCTVSSCAHHGQDSHCLLQSIRVGSTQANVKKAEGTECASFQLGDKGDCSCH